MTRWWAAARRAGRFARPDRNPLRRRSDRAEGLIAVTLLAIFLAASPFAATAVGSAAASAGTAPQSAPPVLYRVRARLATRPAMLAGKLRRDLPPERTAPARWTAPDGTPRSGDVAVSAATVTGGFTWLWTDKHGQVAAAPASHEARAAFSVAAAALTPLLIALLCALAYLAARRALDRRRLAGWEKAWSVVGPRWTMRR